MELRHINHPAYQHRNDLPRMLERLGLHHFAEVGCATGYYARRLLQATTCQSLTLVDTLESSGGSISRELHDLIASDTRIRFLKGPSHSIAKRFASARRNGLLHPFQFDFVYIDAAHDYHNVHQDLRSWAPLCQALLAGHDWWPTNPAMPGAEHGVIPAVTDFAIAYNLPIFTLGYYTFTAKRNKANCGTWGELVPSWLIPLRQDVLDFLLTLVMDDAYERSQQA